ncbi:carbamoyl phosphate synthase small subunit [Virgibacillus profundi]|uniref:Carbamoyl phosphate synthase small chain n=1 Tax=Virgibacillus profundi TaxID=2024555 RepID=A0A2A2IFC5_9BACI|nr:carbamoyl phosphate synthase small subunit [Virgibacillus profundi]PAV29934.1 carbamoyl phosphate synthase small subunit [Virgibacillus profundi]PXY54106.1 carbamoyl phosphate synthase small subunit [Virgibacillus profundi]
MAKRQLILENGTVFTGEGFGSNHTITGELVFNTGMTGYQEVITNPSNSGKIVMMTYPLIGNYGINRDDFETITPSIHGFIVKEAAEFPSNFRSEESLDSYLKVNNIPGISGIDTRKLTKIIRKYGSMNVMIAGVDESVEECLEKLRNLPVESDLVKKVSTVKPYVVPGRGKRIVLVDFGMKHGILRELTKRNCHITVVPYNYSAESIMRLRPDGIMLTNGPGDPKDVPEAIEMVQHVLGEIPVFGVCLGHQIFALACGADTEKMKFGQSGGNYPVKDIQTDKTYLTSQNHSYTVVKDSLTYTELELFQQSLNDGSVQGLKHRKYAAFSVQYHPEGSPGPEDTNYLFDDFLQMIKQTQKENEVKENA